MFEQVVNEAIRLKVLEPVDANDLYMLTDNSRESLREWLPWLDVTKSILDSEAFIESGLKQYDSNNGFQLGIWFHGKLAGVIGLHSIHWGNKATAMGYWLGSDFQGKGIMTTVCLTLVNMIFHEFNLNRIEIRVAVGNTRSRAIPERLGFVKEGCIRQAEWLYDHYVDHVVYGQLASEWNG